MLHEIQRSKKTYQFSVASSPCCEIESGDYLLFYTQDAHSGTIDIKKIFADVPFPELDDNTGNPVTGLVHVKGAAKGKTLKVQILQIIPDEIGVLPVRSYMGILRQVVPERTARVVRYSDNHLWISETISVPARPMIGTIGVAPAADQVPTALPGAHGGNLDNNLITTGSVVYFPIYQDGAFLGVGDIHASMGDAEMTCGGADICARVLVKVEVEDRSLTTQNPIVVQNNSVTTHGFGTTYEESSAMACEEMQKLIKEKMAVSDYEAVLLMAARGDVGLCQACRCQIPMIVRVSFPILWNER
jgi:amidase